MKILLGTRSPFLATLLIIMCVLTGVYECFVSSFLFCSFTVPILPHRSGITNKMEGNFFLKDFHPLLDYSMEVSFFT